MTLDEVITLLKFNNKHIADLKNDDLQQIAEWLEELKELRKIKEDYSKGMQTSYATFMYNKAIDDFCEKLKQDVMATTFGLRICDVDRIAEQLKAGDGE